jgi:hypothetical protein
MSWWRSSLQELFNTGTEFEWAAYTFVTNDPLEEALKPGYFAHWGHGLRPGDLIFFGCNGNRGKLPRQCRPTPVRRALLMVVEGGAKVAVRVVQDWGGVDGPAGGEAVVRQGDGAGPSPQPSPTAGGRGGARPGAGR